MSKLIRIRTDDVLVHSNAMIDKEFEKWRKHHRWVMEAPDYFFHTPAILCSEIQAFPIAIDYIKEEMDAGRLTLDLHGWEHIDYGALTKEQIEEHLEKSFEFFLKTFNCLPFRWATPWGADTPDIRSAARKFSLIVEGVTDPVIDQSQAMELVRQCDSIEPLLNRVVMVHWFERGLKLYRIVQTAKYGSYKKAAEAQPELFK